MPDEQEFEYDVGLSLAGEDRAYVHPIAEALRESGVRVFYDGFNKAEMWGEDLFVFLDEVFRKRAQYAVVFFSRHNVEKHWPAHEAKSAQARALIQQESPYFLPVRLDDSELPGLRPTVGYIDARETGRDRLIELILEKLVTARPIDRVPRTEAEEAVLVAVKPDGWEYLLFGSVLLRERDSFETKWRDHEIRYSKVSGPPLDTSQASEKLSGVFGEVSTTMDNVNRLFDPAVQERAFGKLGEVGDQDRIVHLASRVMDIYGELLDWSARMRGTPVPEPFRRAFYLAGEFADQPARQMHEFVDRVVEEMDRIPAAMREGLPLKLEMTLLLDIREGLPEEFELELEKLEDIWGV